LDVHDLNFKDFKDSLIYILELLFQP